jgi:hypothetical protein
LGSGRPFEEGSDGSAHRDDTDPAENIDVPNAITELQQDMERVKELTLLFDERIRAIESLLSVCHIVS